jgi:hypothetical protein
MAVPDSEKRAQRKNHDQPVSAERHAAIVADGRNPGQGSMSATEKTKLYIPQIRNGQ